MPFVQRLVQRALLVLAEVVTDDGVAEADDYASVAECRGAATQGA